MIPGSPAIGFGSLSSNELTDQRGVSRPADGDGNGTARADMGAYERRLTDTIRLNSFDFDGDGKADVSIFRPGNATWYLQQSQNGFAGIASGIASDKLVPADYDGDGKTDLAVFRNGFWYLQRSQLGFTGIRFGDSNDVPIPADYDSDGRADVAVVRNGVWYLNRTTGGFTGVSFGDGSDKPIPNSFVR